MSRRSRSSSGTVTGISPAPGSEPASCWPLRGGRVADLVAALHGGSDDRMNDTHLMRMAGRFARRVKAWALANGVPLIFCRTLLSRERIGSRGIFHAQQQGAVVAAPSVIEVPGY
jgi:hypothetical protein